MGTENQEFRPPLHCSAYGRVPVEQTVCFGSHTDEWTYLDSRYRCDQRLDADPQVIADYAQHVVSPCENAIHVIHLNGDKHSSAGAGYDDGR